MRNNKHISPIPSPRKDNEQFKKAKSVYSIKSKITRLGDDPIEEDKDEHELDSNNDSS